MSATLNVFVIYASEEHSLLQKLLDHLKPVKTFRKVNFWYDDSIQGNQEWLPQNPLRFENADVYLLLVSNALMHSRFIEQLQFKNIIDRYKSNESKVIPILVDDCPWQIDFEAEDYIFSFKELQVLPENRKPIKKWASSDDAILKSAEVIKKLLSPEVNEAVDLYDGAENKKTESDEKNLQLDISFSEEEFIEEADQIIPEEEVAFEAKIETGEETRIEEEKDEQIVQQQLLEVEEFEAKKRIAKKDGLTLEAKTKQKTDQETELRGKVEATTPQEQIDNVKSKLSGSSINNRAINHRKKLLVGVLMVAFFAVLIAEFSDSTDVRSEEHPVPTEKEAVVVVKKEEEAELPVVKNSSLTTLSAAAVTKLTVGSSFKEGLVFEVSKDGMDGKIVYTTDAGPMIWNDAMKIDEQLGEGWRLPTLEELKTIYNTLGQGADNMGGFADELYWSATPYDKNQARLVRFSDGNSSYHYNSKGTHRRFLVRAVRDINR